MANQPKGGGTNIQPDFNIFLAIFFNLVIVVILGIFVLPQSSSSCITPLASRLSWGCIIVIIAHIFWRSFGQIIKQQTGDSVDLKFIKIPVGVLYSILDQLNFKQIPNLLFGIISIIIALIVAMILSPVSPFRVDDGIYPLIQGFTVQHTGKIEHLNFGDPLNIEPNQRIRIEVLFEEQGNFICKWSANQGELVTTGKNGCATFYNLSFGEKLSTLTVTVNHSCVDRQATASVPLILQTSTPKP
jgi:hypothetical protein